MKVIIAGSRDIAREQVLDILDGMDNIECISEVVSGGADGVDSAGEDWAENRPDPIKVVQFLPEWNKYGRAAGPIRNKQMAEYADMLIAIWNGSSRGTKNMIEQMEKLGKPVILYKIQ